MSEKQISIPATHAELLEKARRVAELNEQIRSARQTNSAYYGPEDRIVMDANAMIARDLLARAEREYQNTLSRYTGASQTAPKESIDG